MTRPEISTQSLSALDARRIALTAQGFGRTSARVGGRPPRTAALRAEAERVHIFQMDPINVVVRSHYLPAYSRLGAYAMNGLDGLAYRQRGMFEYIGHEWSLVAIELHPLLRWRMAAFAGDRRWLRGLPAGYTDQVLTEISQGGAMTPSQLSAPGKRGTERYDAKPGKRALTWLTQSGAVSVADRRGLEQVYDLSERVIPADVLAAPTPERDEARRLLLLHSARALGVGTAKDIVSYFLLGMGVPGVAERATYPKTQTAATLVAELAAEGLLEEVAVEGWDKPAYLQPDAAAPAPVSTRALLSPFDSLLWERDRTERLFGFRYRLEIYVPPAKREYGYYVLPVLVGESLVARLDLKSARKTGRLCVLGAFMEHGVDATSVAEETAAELALFADWLGLSEVAVGTRGNLADGLRRALSAPRLELP